MGKEYVCTVCGYVHKGELPDGFICPVCGAGKDAFKEIVKDSSAVKPDKPSVNLADSELSAMEMSIICSNLARGRGRKLRVDRYVFAYGKRSGRRRVPRTG